MNPPILVTLASALIVGFAIVSMALLRAWSGWLDVRRLELERSRGQPAPARSSAPIELDDLKERVRKLEAIANGVDF